MQDIKATFIWLVLMGLTLLMFSQAQSGFEKPVFVTLLLATSWFKGQMIIDHFMGLRRVALLWRLLISFWLILILVIIASVYLWAG